MEEVMKAMGVDNSDFKGVTELNKIDHQGILFGNIIANFLERKF